MKQFHHNDEHHLQTTLIIMLFCQFYRHSLQYICARGTVSWESTVLNVLIYFGKDF